jgi:hypothetical protein
MIFYSSSVIEAEKVERCGLLFIEKVIMEERQKKAGVRYALLFK